VNHCLSNIDSCPRNGRVMLVCDASGVLIRCISVHNVTDHAAKSTANTSIHTKHNDIGSRTHTNTHTTPHARALTRPHTLLHAPARAHTNQPTTLTQTHTHTRTLLFNVVSAAHRTSCCSCCTVLNTYRKIHFYQPCFAIRMELAWFSTGTHSESP
jgi:hypothetical protein